MYSMTGTLGSITANMISLLIFAGVANTILAAVYLYLLYRAPKYSQRAFAAI